MFPERAYALLGQGRCLAALGKPAAEAPLREARELFASMGYKPELAETEALVHQPATSSNPHPGACRDAPGSAPGAPPGA